MTETQIYDQNFKRIYRFLYYKSVKPPQEIEDVVQEVFLLFFAKYDCTKMSEVEAAKILFGITKNKYKEWVRASIKHQTFELFDNNHADETFEDYVDEEYEYRLDSFRHKAHSAIKLLNPTLRQVMTMRFIDGLTRHEIAEKLGIKEKHVHVYQRRGIAALQKMINEDSIP